MAARALMALRGRGIYGSASSGWSLVNGRQTQRAVPVLTRRLCTKSASDDDTTPPPSSSRRGGVLARLLAPRDGNRNPVLAALGYYSAESRAIGAGNTLYKQALARASAAAKAERSSSGVDDFAVQFEMLSVHVYLTLRRLRSEKGSGYEAEVKTVMQCIFDVFWTDVRSRMMIEERGLTLIESGKWVKDCEQRFFGMALAFDEAWEDERKFREAISRNLTCLRGKDSRVEQFHRYMVRERTRLDTKTVGQLWNGVCWDDKYQRVQTV